MEWQKFVPKVIIPNLKSRPDRKDRMIELLYEYGIEAIIWEATEHKKGAVGLMITMRDIFEWSLLSGYSRILVFEDDCEFLVSPAEFHDTMNKCCEDLDSRNWQVFYLGLQHVEPFQRWITPNLLMVTMGYSTHATMYNEHAMKFYLSSFIDQPIDNFFVEQYQKYNTSYCSFPMLCTQRAGFSNIGEASIDWGIYIKNSFEKATRDILSSRFK